jgi:biopolymer transport protein ExbD
MSPTQILPGADGEESDTTPMSLINTTPLVDVMLVLLIIFLIAVPVVKASVPVRLPQETATPTEADPQTITISVTSDGRLAWNDTPLADETALRVRLTEAAAQIPPPRLHLRGDGAARYETVARVTAACRAAGMTRLGLLTDPGAAE